MTGGMYIISQDDHFEEEGLHWDTHMHIFHEFVERKILLIYGNPFQISFSKTIQHNWH